MPYWFRKPWICLLARSRGIVFFLSDEPVSSNSRVASPMFCSFALTHAQRVRETASNGLIFTQDSNNLIASAAEPRCATDRRQDDADRCGIRGFGRAAQTA